MSTVQDQRSLKLQEHGHMTLCKPFRVITFKQVPELKKTKSYVKTVIGCEQYLRKNSLKVILTSN